MLFTVPFLTEFLRTILIMSISGSLLVLLLFLIKPLVRYRLPKYAQYYMWLIALFALLIPLSKIIVLPNTNENIPITPIYHVVENIILPMGNTKASVPITPPSNVRTEIDYENYETVYKERPDGSYRISYIQINGAAMNHGLLTQAGIAFLYTYLCVAMLIILYGVFSYFYFIAKLRRCPKIALPTELYTLEELKGRQHPRLYRSAVATTPMLTGIFKPTIVLPEREYTDEELRFTLVHELTHLRQFDNIIKWLMLIACAVHWFNPVVWFIRHEIDLIAELSCDDKVIRDMDNAGKQHYGDILIAVAQNTKHPSTVLSTALSEDKKDLKERLSAIMKSKKHTRIGITVSIVIILVTVGAACVLGAASVMIKADNANRYIDKQPPHNRDGRILRDSEYYYVGIGEHFFRIQEEWDTKFILPASVAFSFVGTLDEIREWEATEGRNESAQEIYLGYENPPNQPLVVIDFLDENGRIIKSILHREPGQRQTTSFSPSEPVITYDLDPNIHDVWFLGTRGEMWEKGYYSLKPVDLCPGLRIKNGWSAAPDYVFNLYSNSETAYYPIFHPDDWDMDAVVSAEAVVIGNFDKLMEFYGYTDKEVIELLLESDGWGYIRGVDIRDDRRSEYNSREDFSENEYFLVIELYDESRNVIGRRVDMGMGDLPPDMQHLPVEVFYYRTFDEYEEYAVGYYENKSW